MTLSLVQSYLKITFFFFFPKGIHKLIPKGIKKQAGAQRSQAQLRLGLGFTPTNLHQIDEKESFKHLLFTAPNSLLLAITNLTLSIPSCFSTILGLKVMGGMLQ